MNEGDDPFKFATRMILASVVALVLLLLAAVVALGLLVGGAWAHSFYDAECCSSVDCEPIAADLVRVEGGDYVLPTGDRIPMDQARRSRDRDFHWCRKLNENPRPLIRLDGKLACFYAPQGDM
jgi:hypothetical protein